MDIFFTVLVAGFSTGFFVELVNQILGRWVATSVIKLLATPIFSGLSLYFLGIELYSWVVLIPASGFVALTIMQIVAKSSEITISRR